MFWKKALATAGLAGLLIFAAAGCTSINTAANNTAVTTSITTTPAAPGTIQPPSGNSTAGRQPPNGTMQGSPSDNSTMQGTGGMQPQIDWASAATTLGISEDTLKAAVGDLTSGMPDFAAIAQKLGVTEDALKAALGFTGNNMPPQNGGPGTNTPPPTTTAN